jgi:hypothetical protein
MMKIRRCDRINSELEENFGALNSLASTSGWSHAYKIFEKGTHAPTKHHKKQRMTSKLQSCHGSCIYNKIEMGVTEERMTADSRMFPESLHCHAQAHKIDRQAARPEDADTACDRGGYHACCCTDRTKSTASADIRAA